MEPGIFSDIHQNQLFHYLLNSNIMEILNAQCSAQCGNGVRRRSVQCIDSKGKKINPTDCDDAERPPEILPCNMGPCEGTDWFMSEWTKDGVRLS